MQSRDRFLLPLTYNTLVVESTSRCNAKCGMCYQGAGPRGSDYIGDAALTVDDIQRVLRSAATMPALHKRFHLAGGESFIKLDECVEVFAYAAHIGFLDISCTTNAYWAADILKAYRIAQRLRDAMGLEDVGRPVGVGGAADVCEAEVRRGGEDLDALVHLDEGLAAGHVEALVQRGHADGGAQHALNVVDRQRGVADVVGAARAGALVAHAALGVAAGGRFDDQGVVAQGQEKAVSGRHAVSRGKR